MEIDVGKFNQAVGDMQTATSNMKKLASIVEATARQKVDAVIDDLDIRNSITIHVDQHNITGNASDTNGDGSRARPFSTFAGVRTKFKAGRQHRIVLMGSGNFRITTQEHNYFTSTGVFVIDSDTPWYVDEDPAKGLNHAAMPSLQSAPGCYLGAGNNYNANCVISIHKVVPHLREKVSPNGREHWTNAMFLLLGQSALTTDFKALLKADAKDVAQSLVYMDHLAGVAFKGRFENMQGNFIHGVSSGQNISEALSNPGIRCNRIHG